MTKMQQQPAWFPCGRTTAVVLFMGHGPARGWDHEVFNTSRVGRGWDMGVLEISRVGFGRVRRFSNLTGQGPVALTRSDPREVIRLKQVSCLC